MCSKPNDIQVWRLDGKAWDGDKCLKFFLKRGTRTLEVFLDIRNYDRCLCMKEWIYWSIMRVQRVPADSCNRHGPAVVTISSRLGFLLATGHNVEKVWSLGESLKYNQSEVIEIK